MLLRGGIGVRNLKVAPEILCQVVIKLMEQRGGSIESRDLGRELNRISVDEDGTTALSVIKEVRGAKQLLRGGGKGEAWGLLARTGCATEHCRNETAVVYVDTTTFLLPPPLTAPSNTASFVAACL